MAKLTRVAVICGGNSSEREISLWSGRAMIGHLDPARFVATLVDLQDILVGGPWPIERLIAEFDVAFLALHGAGGEDGCLQGLLDFHGVPYTGSGVLASALAMDKAMTKKIYRDAGIPVARDIVFSRAAVASADPREARGKVQAELGFPVVVKVDNQGSSRGVRIVGDAGGFGEAWSEAVSQGACVLVEEFVKGREFTVPVLGGADPRAFPVVEIVPRTGGFFDYEAKYAPGGSDELVPAPIDAAATRQLSDLGLAAHLALGCWGMSRTDILVSESGQPVVLETNTLPGLTEASLFPKSVLAAGWTLEQMAGSLIDWAFERAKRARAVSPC